MANKHVLLNNRKNNQSGFNRKRGFTQETEDEETEEPTIKQFQVANLRNYYNAFTESYARRYAQRTIEFPAYIDLIEIHFFAIFNKDLKNKFYQKYGLLPISYKNFNRTVLFEVIDTKLFAFFKADIEFIISLEEDVPYSGENHNLISIIFQFEFFNDRATTREQENLIISTIQSASTGIASLQKEKLKQFLIDGEFSFTINDNQDFIYLNEMEHDTVSFIEQNFDIVQSITSSRALNVRPGMFGTLRMEYGFQVEIPDSLPIVGIIDTGVNLIEPFRNLIAPNGINISGETDSDHSGHGTLVAGLAIFGADLPASMESSYKAKCKVLPIKVIHNNNDGINFPLLLTAIKSANQDSGVRIFNMSLVFYPKKYNETFSDFAYELDRLSHELGILIFISVGNFDAISLEELLTTDFHSDHVYPDFFYKLNTSSPFHRCENTNISTPSESLNNISVGALAGNIESKDNSDITPFNIYPAYYSRKFHFDYEQKLNSTVFNRNQKNKHLNKPDLVFDGGDLLNAQSGIEVLSVPGINPDNYFTRTAGTSLSTPLITSIAAEIERFYPELHVQSIKALLINSAAYYKPKQLPDFKGKEGLLRKLIGFGVPGKVKSLFSDNNSITMIIEDHIKTNEILAVPIFLPEYLKANGNKLTFNITLAYSSYPDKGNHLGYLPLHISFNLMKNISINDIASKPASETVAKKGFSWSEDHFGKENILFSNAQTKEYRLQTNDIISLNGELAIAIRCLTKENVDENLKVYLENNQHPFSIIIKISEEIKNETEHQLYSEMFTNNSLTVINEIESDASVELEN